MSGKVSPLAYPCGVRAGYDPSHIAATGGTVRLSAVPSTANYIRLDPNAQLIGVINAAGPTYSVDGIMGPVLTYNGTQNTKGIQFNSEPVVTDTSNTIAAIFSIASLAADIAIFNNNHTNGSASLDLEILTTGVLELNSSFVLITGPTLSVNVPYFVIASCTSGSTLFVVKNLLSGQTTVTTSTTTYTAAANNLGTYNIGCFSPNGYSYNGSIAAVMYSNIRLSLPQALVWANDPWSFWYPRGRSSVVGVAAAHGSIGTTLILMGVG